MTEKEKERKMKNKFYNMDCVKGAQDNIDDNSIDLIITDPPYGIAGDTLHKHYNRDEKHVINGYVEVPSEKYEEFSLNWINEAERILKPGGTIYIVSGYTKLYEILKALRKTSLQEINHIIWKYNFGVYTKRKYISSHYHILYYTKPGEKHIFNTFSRFGADEKTDSNRSMNYQDREDVWIINKEYKHGKIKNKNELPGELLQKMIMYSSNPDDIVCDLFLGSFSTAKIAMKLGRNATGFEISKNAYDYQIEQVEKIKFGSLLSEIKEPQQSMLFNQGKSWTEIDIKNLCLRYDVLYDIYQSKVVTIEKLSEEFGRGRFAITNILKKRK